MMKSSLREDTFLGCKSSTHKFEVISLLHSSNSCLYCHKPSPSSHPILYPFIRPIKSSYRQLFLLIHRRQSERASNTQSYSRPSRPDNLLVCKLLAQVPCQMSKSVDAVECKGHRDCKLYFIRN
jgi:hypothetical protein